MKDPLNNLQLAEPPAAFCHGQYGPCLVNGGCGRERAQTGIFPTLNRNPVAPVSWLQDREQRPLLCSRVGGVMGDGEWMGIDVCSLKKGPWDLLEGWGGVMGARSDTGVCEASGDMTF